MYRKINLFLTLSCFSFLFLSAQESGDLFGIGQFDTLQSEILQQERPYIVSLPDRYEEGDKSYPVMYLLDG
ncbi:MAG: hypothetical protein AAFQ68_15475, partial [Bacteroidota bacterium]